MFSEQAVRSISLAQMLCVCVLAARQMDQLLRSAKEQEEMVRT